MQKVANSFVLVNRTEIFLILLFAIAIMYILFQIRKNILFASVINTNLKILIFQHSSSFYFVVVVVLFQQHFPYMIQHKHQEKKEKSYNTVKKLLKKFPLKLENKLEISQLDAEEQYLVSATTMDCSIMITFRQIPLESVGNCER